MSVSKKRAAPKPPVANLAIGSNKENEISGESDNANTQKGSFYIKVVKPDQSVEEIQVDSGTSLIDLRSQLCGKYKFSPGSYTIEPVDSDGRLIQCTPSSTVGSLKPTAVHLKPKTKESAKVTPVKIPEPTVRLVIKMPGNQQQVIRVLPNVPLNKLEGKILEKTPKKQQDYEFLELRHPEQVTMALDMTRSLDDYKIREVFVADKRATPESPEPETAPSPQLPEKTPKMTRGGSEKRSKKIKRFFGLSKKKKSQSSDDATSPTTISPTVSEAMADEPEEATNSNGNNSKERENGSKQRRQGTLKQPDIPKNEPLHGQVSGKIDDGREIENEERMEVESDAEVKKTPASPPPRPTAPPRAKPRAPVAATRLHATGKKKAPPPPTMVSPPTSPTKPDSPTTKPSRPEKPPRRQSIERQKEHSDVESDNEKTEEDSLDETEKVTEEIQSPHEKVEEIVKQANVDQELEDEKRDKSDDEMGAEEVPESQQMTLEKEESGDGPPGHIEEEIRDVPIENLPGEDSLEVEDGPVVAAVITQDEEPSNVVPPEVEPVQVQEEVVAVKTQDEEPSDVVPPDVKSVQIQEEVGDAKSKKESSEVDENEEKPQDEWVVISQEEVEEVKEAVKEEIQEENIADVGQPQGSPTKEEIPLPPLDVEDEVTMETPKKTDDPPEVEDVPSEVADMVHHEIQHDLGYKPEEILKEEDLVKDFDIEEEESHPDHTIEEPVPPPPRVEASALKDDDNLFTTPDDFNVYETKKEDYASAEAKALEMIKQFTLAAEAANQASQTGNAGPEKSPVSANVPAGNEAKSDDIDEEVALQEIERLKEQINVMRQKKAKKEAEEEYAKKHPYTIVPATEKQAVVEPGQVQNTRVKTFTFVPNQKQKKIYEDYEAAPQSVINLSQSGEIRGIGFVSETDQVKQSSEVETAHVEPVGHIETPKETVETSPVENVNEPTPVISQPVGAAPKSISEAEKPEVQKPKGLGSYVSSAILKEHITAKTQPKTTTTTAYDTSGKKSTLPNYYRRFFGKDTLAEPEPKIVKVVDDAVVAQKKSDPPTVSPEKSTPKPSPRSPTSPKPPIPEKPKSPTFVAKPPKSPPLATTVNNILNPSPIENLPPPEETKRNGASNFDDTPLPPPPEEFLTPAPEQDVPASLPLPPPVEQPPTFSNPDTPPNKATSPVYSPNFVGISSAKPFGGKGGSNGPKFRPMAANFKGGKTNKASSP